MLKLLTAKPDLVPSQWRIFALFTALSAQGSHKAAGQKAWKKILLRTFSTFMMLYC